MSVRPRMAWDLKKNLRVDEVAERSWGQVGFDAERSEDAGAILGLRIRSTNEH